MKRLFRNIALLILVFLGLNWLASGLFRSQVLSRSVLFRKDIQFENFDDTLTWLLLGDSRIQNDIDPRIVGNCFNYSSANENVFQTYFKLKKIIEQGRKPEYILMNLDYSLLSNKHSNRFKYDSYWSGHMNYFEMVRVKKDWKFIMRYLQGKFFTYAGEYKLLNEFLFSKKARVKSDLIDGFRPRIGDFSKEKNRESTGLEKAEFYLRDGIYMEEQITLYFEKLLELCEVHGIKVVLVMMPMTREFLDGIDRIIPGNTYYRDLGIILNKYTCIESVLNYQEVFSDKPEYFWNPDHMNFRGAEAFTRLLKKDLDEINTTSSF